MNTTTHVKINDLLADWDPIGIGLPISKDEYKGYIPQVYNAIKNKKDLKKVLLSILQNDLCLDINTDDKELNSDLDKLISELTELVD